MYGRTTVPSTAVKGMVVPQEQLSSHTHIAGNAGPPGTTIPRNVGPVGPTFLGTIVLGQWFQGDYYSFYTGNRSGGNNPACLPKVAVTLTRANDPIIFFICRISIKVDAQALDSNSVLATVP